MVNKSELISGTLPGQGKAGAEVVPHRHFLFRTINKAVNKQKTKL
jgi:hypothetical protein